MPPVATHTDNLKELVEESRETITKLEERASEIATRIEKEPDDYFLLGSADLQAQVYYAPLYNLPKHAVAVITREPGHTLLREIRERFLVNIGPSGFLRELCGSIRRSQVHDGDLFLIAVDPEGTVGEVYCYDERCSQRDLALEVKQTVKSLPIIGPELRKFIKDLHEGLGQADEQFSPFFLIRAEPRFAGPRRSTDIDIMQIGVAFLSSSTFTEHQIWAFQRLSQISSFATISLLYEKERYYEKAVRQAVRGSIIKSGKHSDIANQVKILRALQAAKKWNVPTVNASDPLLNPPVRGPVDSDERKRKFAWYIMPWFVTPSLMDIISLTEGFERYEIAALIRSGFMHIQRNYWREDIQLQSARLLPSLLLPLTWAINRAETAFDNISSQTKAILNGEPVKFERGIDFFGTSHLNRLLPVLDPILEHQKYVITLNWIDSAIFSAEILINPITELKTLVDVIVGNVAVDEDIHRLRIRTQGKLHGDAHFGNLLVDASVPEDPFIISIDPTVIDPAQVEEQIPEPTLDFLKHSFGEVELHEEFAAIASDPVYDVAKFVLSTSCCYGLVYRNGFVIKRGGEALPEFQLSMNEEAGPEKLKDAGGISGAQIVRIAPKVPRGAWDNHCIAARRTLHEYRTLQNQHRGNMAGDRFFQSVNVGLIRLWFLTVRHAFSVAGKLFPVKMTEAIAMYLLATLFVNRGISTISALFADKSQLMEEATAQKLIDLFLWDSELSA